MQKVSKQSLAMLALSILLAISIALTFTFALMADSRTATGTITFSSGGTVTWTPNSQSDTIAVTASGNNVEFTLTEADFTINEAGTTATLNKGFGDAKVTFQNMSSIAMYYKISITFENLNGASQNTASNHSEDIMGNIANKEATAVGGGAVGTVTYTLDKLLELDGTKLTLTGPSAGQLAQMTNAKVIVTAEFNFNAAYQA